jgi:hypothetical protein
MTRASGFQIRKLVTPPLPNEFEIIKWTISRNLLFYRRFVRLLSKVWPEKKRFSDNS